MAASIEAARLEVESSFSNALRVAEEGERSFWVFEKELWTAMLAVGRAMVALFLARQAARPSGIRAWRGTDHGDRHALRQGGIHAVGR